MRTYKEPAMLHTDSHVLCATKTDHAVCGDCFDVSRDSQAMTAVLADGLGSGIRASVSSKMACATIINMIKAGFTEKEAAASVIKTAKRVKENQKAIYAAFTIVRILNDGSAHVLTYDAPMPVFVTRTQAYTAEMKFSTIEGQVIGEAKVRLNEGDGLLIMTDGVTQAGIGKGLAFGWTEKGVCDFVSSRRAAGFTEREMPEMIINQARVISGGTLDDDTSAVYFSPRRGRVMSILTGPPFNKADDERTARSFMEKDGIKVICGSTTADMVSRVLGRTIGTEKTHSAFIRPPKYFMEGVELVTEGAVVLNQLYNIIDAEGMKLDRESCVSELAALAALCDSINIYMGMSVNPAHNDIAFTQLGILPRQTIVPKLAKKLRDMGKLVVIKEI